jgi:L-malate glycosyltransferase
MKILYLMTEPFGIGGVQSDMIALSRLNDLGHQVYVATESGDLVDELEKLGTQFVPISFNVRGLFSALRTAGKLRNFIVNNKIDMLAPQSIKTTLFSYLSLRLFPFFYKINNKRLPIVTTIHNIHNPANFKYAGKILNTCPDYVIFESNYERDRCMASGLSSSKSVVINSGIDVDKYVVRDADTELLKEYSIDKSKNTIFGIIARLSEEKGHNYLLEAFKLVLNKIPDAKLLIVGDGPLEDEVKAYCSKLGLDNSVIFAGSRRDISEHLSILDVFVLSSTRESFPLAAREAMAAGKAVIAPNIGGCPEVVDNEKTGFLFESRNSEDLSEKMLTIIENNRYLEFGEKSRQKAVDYYSINAWVKNDEQLYLNYI